MKSFSILAGLVGLASATGWNETWTHHPSSSSSSSSSSSLSSSSSWVKPSGWVSESKSSSVPVQKPTGWVPEHSSSVATSSVEQNATSTLVTYVTTTVCPATSVINGHTSIYQTTSTITVTSCKGGCSHKPTEAPSSSWAPSSTAEANATSTEVVYTTTTVCPVVTTKQGHTFTQYVTSTLVLTSCKGGCSKTQSWSSAVETPKSTVVVPYPTWNATTQGHAGPSGAAPSPKTKTVTDVSYTTVTTCSSGEVITTGGSKTTLTTPSVITKTLISKSTKDVTISVPTQGHAVPTTPIYQNGTTKYITEKTTTYLTTCPVSSVITTGGTTKTSIWTTVSTATSVIKVSKTASSGVPVSSAVSASTGKPSIVSPVGTGKVTVVVPVTQYTTTCPYTSVDQHGSTSIWMTTSVVSKPVTSPSAPAESHPAASPSSSAASVSSVKQSETHSVPVAPSSKPVESAPVQSKPASSPVSSAQQSVETHPASSPVSPVQQTSQPTQSAPATTPAASSAVKPSGPVVTQISDGQIQVPASSAPAGSSVASVLSSSVHANAPSSTSGSVASATTSLPATYTGAASKTNASFMAAVAAVAAVFFF